MINNFFPSGTVKELLFVFTVTGDTLESIINPLKLPPFTYWPGPTINGIPLVNEEENPTPV